MSHFYSWIHNTQTQITTDNQQYQKQDQATQFLLSVTKSNDTTTSKELFDYDFKVNVYKSMCPPTYRTKRKITMAQLKTCRLLL